MADERSPSAAAAEQPELIADYRCHTGEGPLWHPSERRLYWADIPTGRMFRYDPDTGKHEQFYDGDVVGGFTIQADGSLLLFMAGGRVASWRDGELTNIIDELPGEEGNRFNDVIADPAGRVFCGTMPLQSDKGGEMAGSLYRLDTEGSMTTVLSGLGISNGMGFTPDLQGMYFTDTVTRKISIFDYDESTGRITDQRVVVETPEGEGVGPDGMTVDVEGHLWSARYDGGALYRYSSDGEEERRIDFPTAKKVTSVIFAGDGYTDMYVTTGGGQDRAANGSESGGLFRLRPGVAGRPEFPSRVGL
jgi:D-xylonolactonase